MDQDKAKLDDVARVAKVSRATASRALSAPELVRAATLSRVRDAARLLGYVPHGAARALASRRTHTIGAVVPTLDNPIFANSIQALQRELDEHGYQLLLGSHEYDPWREVGVTRALVERGVDGLMLVGTDHGPALYPLLATFHIPHVLAWSLDESGHHDCVGFDNRGAAARMARHLVDLGHRHLAVVTGFTANNDRARDRVAGVRDVLAAHGIGLAPDGVMEFTFAVQSGREALQRALRLEPRPTALICGNDVLAQGALIAAHTQASTFRAAVDHRLRRHGSRGADATRTHHDADSGRRDRTTRGPSSAGENRRRRGAAAHRPGRRTDRARLDRTAAGDD
jgi:LacI family transcriptional regulator